MLTGEYRVYAHTHGSINICIYEEKAFYHAPHNF